MLACLTRPLVCIWYVSMFDYHIFYPICVQVCILHILVTRAGVYSTFSRLLPLSRDTINVCLHTHTHTYARTHTRTHTHTPTHLHARAHTSTHIHTHTHAHTPTHVHACTHTFQSSISTLAWSVICYFRTSQYKERIQETFSNGPDFTSEEKLMITIYFQSR